MDATTNKIIKIAMNYINLLKDEGYTIDKAFLFGSFAKKNYNKDSDIDIAIISKEFSGQRFTDSIKLLKLRRRIDSRIEPIPYNRENFKENDPLVIEIKRHGIKIG